jgi:transposase
VLFRSDLYPDWYRPFTADQENPGKEMTVTAQPIVAHCHPFVVGVDTHARNHVYAIIDSSNGALLDTQSFPVSSTGINWVARRTQGAADTLWVIEGTATYGAILAGTVAAHGFPVTDAPRMSKKQNRGVGKSDALDAHRMAIASLPLPVDKLRHPRLHEGIRQGLRILVTARSSMAKDRTRSVNALNAVVRSNELGIDARKKLTGSQIAEISR